MKCVRTDEFRNARFDEQHDIVSHILKINRVVLTDGPLFQVRF
jgi:hypothetical protein